MPAPKKTKSDGKTDEKRAQLKNRYRKPGIIEDVVDGELVVNETKKAFLNELFEKRDRKEVTFQDMVDMWSDRFDHHPSIATFHRLYGIHGGQASLEELIKRANGEIKEKRKVGGVWVNASYLTPRERRRVRNAELAKKTCTKDMEEARRLKRVEEKKKEDKAVKDVEKVIDKDYRKKIVEVPATLSATSRPARRIDKALSSLSPDKKIVFKPNEGPQTDFLAAPETDVFYGGAAGGGKSYALLIDPLRYVNRAAHRALILRRTMPELRELIDKTRELYPSAYNGAKFKEVEKRWIFPSGATIEFGFLERDADVYRYQGQAYSFIGFDELPQLATEFSWHYLASRLRTTDKNIICYMRATGNPGGAGSHWVKARYITPAPPNTGFIGVDGVSRKFIPATLFDNPYLSEGGNYEKMLRSLPEVQRKRLLEGDWDVTDGAAFPEFSQEKHVIPPFEIPKSWARVKGVDYGYASPSACIWAAIDPDDNTMIVYKELYQKGLTGEELGQRIVEMEWDEIRSIPGVLDTAAWNRTGYTGPTIGEILNKPPYSLKLRPADKNRIAGKVQVHERLRCPIRPDGEYGRPKLQIFSTCKNLIRELQSIPLSETNSEDVDTKAEDHAYDALRYLIMSRPKETRPIQMHHNIRTWSPVDEQFGY